MKPVWYTACEKFGPAAPEAWSSYLALARLPQLVEVISLAVIKEPDDDLASLQDERFSFVGFDLVEGPGTGVSALVNCGGFEKAFHPEEKILLHCPYS